MMYPFMTLNDDTEITHSEMKPDGKVKVYIETRFDEIIHSMAHLIIEFSQEGGFNNASNF